MGCVSNRQRGFELNTERVVGVAISWHRMHGLLGITHPRHSLIPGQSQSTRPFAMRATKAIAILEHSTTEPLVTKFDYR